MRRRPRKYKTFAISKTLIEIESEAMECVKKMSNKKKLFLSLIKKIEKILKSPLSKNKKLLEICKVLKRGVKYYDWVGFYFVDKRKKNELVLGPFIGEPTEHTRIGFGKGICGQAAERKSTFIVQDVSKEKNYLSCSSKVKSEMVVPIFKNKEEIIGELDIDSHTLSPFTKEDKEFLEKICGMIREIL